MPVRANLSQCLRGPPAQDGPPDADGAAPEVGSAVEDGEGEGRALLCRTCEHLITRGSARLTVRGQHEHVCVNPSGIPFRIGCFRTAPGCAPRGPSYDYWSWFAGYRWQIVVCAGCQTHLGWAFHGEQGAGFFGLITARLIEKDTGDDG